MSAAARERRERKAVAKRAPLPESQVEAMHAQLHAALDPIFGQWQGALDKAATRLGALTEEEVKGGMHLAPDPRVTVEAIWLALVAWDLVDAAFGKWIATIGVATIVGGGYVLPTVQIALASRRIREAEERRTRGATPARTAEVPS